MSHVKIESRAIGYVFLFGGCMELSNPGMFKERSGWSGRDRIAEIHRLPPVIRLIRKRTAGATPGSARISDFPARIRGHFGGWPLFRFGKKKSIPRAKMS